MFCSNCGHEIQGNFCAGCGAPVSAQFTASSKSPTFHDKVGNQIDLAMVRGVYKNRIAISGYLKRCTDYPSAEISQIADYILAEVAPAEIKFVEAVVLQSKLEASSKPAKQSPRQRIKESKASGVACCPRCGSTSLSANKKGFGIGKAVIGATLTANPIGLIAGNINAKKLWVTCLNCGNRWKT